MFDNIVAISTGGMSNVPISIIRVSGIDSFEIVKKIFTGKIGKDKTITYGFIKENNLKIDEVLISWFVAPNTFTGENVVEINAHGGIVNTNKILRMILSNGARLAEPGEFSRRAFLNGKMDLIKADSIHDLIFAKTEEQAILSVKKFDGQTSELIESLKKEILEIISIIEINIDYPEYDDVEQLTKKKLLPKLIKVKKQLKEIIVSSKKSKYIYKGVNVAIIGKPNVGKSSLFNALLNEQKAIVTEIPGTTRDVIEGSIQIGQMLLNFQDTAGIHKTLDKVEKIGIEKSFDKIKKADLIIHVLDPLDELNNELQNQIPKNTRYLKVFNKSDIKKREGISISAKNYEINNLIFEIKKIYQEIDLNNEKIINNTRQLSLIEKSLNYIKESIDGLKNFMEPNVVIIDIKNAWENLSSILGNFNQTDLLDEMFKNFCLGK